MNALVTSLRWRQFLLMDGAMGTELQRLTQASSFEGFEQLNLVRPDVVASVHRAYVEAGAQVLLTNTFQANPERISASELHAIWQAALRLARDAAPRFVLADIGPCEFLVKADARRLRDECGAADGILLET